MRITADSRLRVSPQQVQEQVSKDFEDQEAWAKRCIINVASGGTAGSGMGLAA